MSDEKLMIRVTLQEQKLLLRIRQLKNLNPKALLLLEFLEEGGLSFIVVSKSEERIEPARKPA